MGNRPLRLALIAFLTLCAFALPRTTVAFGDEDDIVNPWTAESPSGEYRLSVMPSQADGSGPATYTMEREGKVLWKTEHPFTLREGAVTDKGEVAGYAYSHGFFGSAPEGESSTLNAIIVSHDGSVRLNEAHQRKHPSADTFTPVARQPRARGLILDSASDRFVLRTMDNWPFTTRSWWVYRLSTGERLHSFDPWATTPGRGQHALEVQVMLVPGTPLVATQWSVIRGEPKGEDAVYDVFTLDGRPVWTRLIPDEWTNERRPTRPFELPANHPKRRMWASAGELVIASGSQNERRRYSVVRDADAFHGWRVVDQGVEPWTPNHAAESTATALPSIQLERVVSITLQWPAQPRYDPFRPAIGSIVDRHGHLLLQHPTTGSVLRFDDAGLLIGSTRPDNDDFPGMTHFPKISVGSDETVWARRERNDFVRFAPDGARVGVEEPLELRGHELWFAQPNSRNRWVLRFDGLRVIDGERQVLCLITRQPDGGWLRPAVFDAAVGPQGHIVVRSQRSLCVYDASGEPRGMVRSWDADFRLQAAGGPLATNGEWVAENDNGMILLYRVSRPADPPFRFVPPREKGQQAYWEPLFSPDGRELWIRNADSFTIERYRLPD